MPKQLKVFTNTTFTGYYPVGTSAIVVASGAAIAVRTINTALERRGLKGDVEKQDMLEVDLDYRSVRVLNDGNY